LILLGVPPLGGCNYITPRRAGLSSTAGLSCSSFIPQVDLLKSFGGGNRLQSNVCEMLHQDFRPFTSKSVTFTFHIRLHASGVDSIPSAVSVW